MAFPTANAHSFGMSIPGKAVTTVTPLPQLQTGTFGYSMFNVPGVVDVSGMEFGVTVIADGGSGVNAGVASGASTIELLFADLGQSTVNTPLAGGSGAGSINHLTNPDDFSNTITGGWTTGLMRTAVGTSVTDLDADDVIGLHVVANLSGSAGIGHVGVKVAYVYGKPGSIG